MKDEIFNAICLTNYLDESNKIDDCNDFFEIILKRIIENKFDTTRFIYRVFNNEIFIFSDSNPKNPLFIWSIFINDNSKTDPIIGIDYNNFIDNKVVEINNANTIFKSNENGIIKIDLKSTVETIIFNTKLKPLILNENLNSIYFYNDKNIIIYEYIKQYNN